MGNRRNTKEGKTRRKMDGVRKSMTKRGTDRTGYWREARSFGRRKSTAEGINPWIKIIGLRDNCC